ncbi:alpha-soluble NSF attachment protein-like [Watersipora subatra]|uniref:alpha-soluble NSF attachment protein-like n=1 Tax=Watersipora subatra TaxID=2589382 RepID=UPI00355BF8DD
MAGDPNESRAIQLVAEAEKKIKSSTGFLNNLFGGGVTKLEEASDLYSKAANNYKMAKNWSGAGSSFCECANLQLKLSSRHDAATAFVDAGNCYRKCDPTEAIACLLKAIEIYTDMGRFTIAAKHHITIAEICEQETADVELAIKHYATASDYYRGEESTSAANKCSLKVATLSAQVDPPDFEKAAQIFEMLGTSAMDNTLLKYSAKDHFFKAVLCQLCIDVLNGQLALNKYKEMQPAFADSRECKFLEKILPAIEGESTEDFTAAVTDYDSISRLDSWMTAILLRIKKQINEEEDLK